MNISSPSRKTSVRKPSHLGSKIQPSPDGNSSTRVASMGSSGGLIGSSIATIDGASFSAARLTAPRSDLFTELAFSNPRAPGALALSRRQARELVIATSGDHCSIGDNDFQFCRLAHRAGAERD